ncbi:uncharacterized protein LOC135830142 [Sycon ciliatum]|uniref:uncharacterized protein LOC135830142 n=1 Tax=Sycon ciliatum TaxID=27933 RepID=UPI0020AC7DCC|eukprot:scpid89220/ scgid22915/ 
MSMVHPLLIRHGLNVLVLVTIWLMMASNAKPEWYEVESARAEIGIWRLCVTRDVRRCVSLLKDRPGIDVNGSLRSAQAFSVLATIFSCTAAVLIFVMELGLVKPDMLLGIPRVLLALSALFMFVGALSFLGFIDETSLSDLPDSRYSISFIFAWVSVGTAVASALLAHFHHSALANKTF